MSGQSAASAAIDKGEGYKDYKDDWQDQEPDLGPTSVGACMSEIAEHYATIAGLYRRMALATASNKCAIAYEALAIEAEWSAYITKPAPGIVMSF